MSVSTTTSRVPRNHHLPLLRGLITFSVLSTAAHFTHNFVEIQDYPDDTFSHELIQVLILISWPTVTAIGLWGYRLYKQERYSAAHPCLLLYSLLGISTLGHFPDGIPDIPPFWLATIFTDAIAGFSLLAFTVWSMRSHARRAPGP